MPGRGAFAALALGVLIASSSSILVRYAQAAGVDSIAIAAWRLAFAAVLLLPWVFARRGRELAALPRRDLVIALVAGLALAAHFATWISSLEHTSIASSAALVSTNPIWVGLASVLLLGLRLSAPTVAGIVLSLAGCLMILAADGAGSSGSSAGVLSTDLASAGLASAVAPNPLFGNGLALVGALCISAYLLIGRGLAARVSLLLYIGLVYGFAAIALMLAALLYGVPLTGWSLAGWWLLLGLALGPQLIGHTAFNWALRHLSPTFVALSILGEPIGSAVFAALLFGEVPGLWQSLALAVLLAGIGLAALGERKRL